jgi:hypothetical protein
MILSQIWPRTLNKALLRDALRHLMLAPYPANEVQVPANGVHV